MTTKQYISLDILNVSINFDEDVIPVGRLAYKNRRIYFEYDRDFLDRKLPISPFMLPLKSGLHEGQPELFEGLPGVFNDSLPDGWGRLLLDRLLRSKGYQSGDFTPLDRLAYIGAHGMGALVYEPDYSQSSYDTLINLDALAQASQQVLEGESSEVLEELLRLGGSSAGARPKATIGLSTDKRKIIEGTMDLDKDYEPWIVKFANSMDGADAGAIEYVYSQMARMAGIDMPETHLFPAREGAGYFATKRFDRDTNGKRLHMHTACGLLHSDFRTPSLDYEDLIKVTMTLTRDIRAAQAMYRLAVFNVLSYNRDDHSKNFSFLMDKNDTWTLSPAYDLTFSSGPRGEQSTMVAGEGKNPTKEHLLKLVPHADLKPKQANEIIDQVHQALSHWSDLAKDAGVTSENINLIESRFKE
ncbi:MAG: phosphatidylinositol kinase [Alphaproteobacteria bacterium CG11_big_fil_rev_8_21_14_0_20_39_49]|nr:MAG: phosphatidylinositol kinase [Alphaproteobacteria bacterium CG11_big_fil_rev_8_21_14_0_20_39_49]